MCGLNVKNTIVERVLGTIAPHPCSGCGKVGSVLCSYCKYNITYDPFIGCIICGTPVRGGICLYHNSPISRAFVVGERSGTLKAAIDSLKFHNLKAVAKDLAVLLDESLPLLPADTILVPIPTVQSHIRQRGYDQVELIVRHFASIRGLKVVKALQRVGKETQHTLARTERVTASKNAFRLNAGSILPTDAPILILDDIITTGSTVQNAAQLLNPLSSRVWVVALAYQPLD